MTRFRVNFPSTLVESRFVSSGYLIWGLHESTTYIWRCRRLYTGGNNQYYIERSTDGGFTWAVFEQYAADPAAYGYAANICGDGDVLGWTFWDDEDEKLYIKVSADEGANITTVEVDAGSEQAYDFKYLAAPDALTRTKTFYLCASPSTAADHCLYYLDDDNALVKCTIVASETTAHAVDIWGTDIWVATSQGDRKCALGSDATNNASWSNPSTDTSTAFALSVTTDGLALAMWQDDTMKFTTNGTTFTSASTAPPVFTGAMPCRGATHDNIMYVLGTRFVSFSFNHGKAWFTAPVGVHGLNVQFTPIFFHEGRVYIEDLEFASCWPAGGGWTFSANALIPRGSVTVHDANDVRFHVGMPVFITDDADTLLFTGLVESFSRHGQSRSVTLQLTSLATSMAREHVETSFTTQTLSYMIDSILSGSPVGTTISSATAGL